MKKWLPWMYLGLGLSQAAHSIEEVLTGLWRWMPLVSGAVHLRLSWVPILHMPEMTFIIANMVIITLMLGFSPFPFLNPGWPWKVATVVAIIETINGIGHISAALVTGGYFSGCIAAIGLIAFSVPIWGRKWIFRKEMA
jgi:hypothetical protein